MAENFRYFHNTSEPQRAYEDARQFIPGGVQGNIKYYEPYPLSIASADGVWLKECRRPSLCRFSAIVRRPDFGTWSLGCETGH